jgi:hypothetical protein
MGTQQQIATNRAIARKSTTPKAQERLAKPSPAAPKHGRHATHCRALSARKINLNKPTHFDEATKALTPPTPISKPIQNPLKSQK